MTLKIFTSLKKMFFIVSSKMLLMFSFSIADFCDVALHGLDSHLDGTLTGQVTPDETGCVDENAAWDSGRVREFLVNDYNKTTLSFGTNFKFR